MTRRPYETARKIVERLNEIFAAAPAHKEK
jgi:hypothetical protein